MIPWIFVVTAAAWAEPLSLRYEDALRMAQAGNASLRGAGTDLAAAEGALLAARGTFDPTLDASLRYGSDAYEGQDTVGTSFAKRARGLSSDTVVSWFGPTGTSASLDLSTLRSSTHYDQAGTLQDFDTAPQFSTTLQASVSQALLRGYKMSYNLAGVRKATALRDEAEATEQVARQAALADTATAYWGLYSARRATEIAQRTLEVATEEQRVVSAQIAVGKMATMEQARADALAVQAQSALLTAQNDEATASDALLLLIGEAPGQAVVLSTAPSEPTPVSLDEDAVLAAFLANNPSLQALRLAEKSAQESASDARHGRLPQLDANAAFGLNGYEPSLGASLGEVASASLPTWSVGASLSAPLGNRALRGAADQATAAATAARDTREAAERSVAQQVRAQVRTLQASASQLQLALANQTYANQTLAAERALQDVGRAVQRDVLEAITNADSAAVSVEQARATWLLSIVKLEQLKGTL